MGDGDGQVVARKEEREKKKPASQKALAFFLFVANRYLIQ